MTTPTATSMTSADSELERFKLYIGGQFFDSGALALQDPPSSSTAASSKRSADPVVLLIEGAGLAHTKPGPLLSHEARSTFEELPSDCHRCAAFEPAPLFQLRSAATVLSRMLPPPLVGTSSMPGNRWAVWNLEHRFPGKPVFVMARSYFPACLTL